MSASAGISAAKRRRGVVTSLNEQVTNKSLNDNKNDNKQVVITPIQILQNHEIRLNVIEKSLKEVDDYANTKMINNNNNNNNNNNKENNEVDQIQMYQSNEALSEYKKRCENLENKVAELESLIQKVQTFTMEINTEYLVSKRMILEKEDNYTCKMDELNKYLALLKNNRETDCIKENVEEETNNTM